MPENHTFCTICERWVGATRNWSMRHAGRSDNEWRVARHRSTTTRRSHGPQDICSGGGILIPGSVVFPTKEDT